MGKEAHWAHLHIFSGSFGVQGLLLTLSDQVSLLESEAKEHLIVF